MGGQIGTEVQVARHDDKIYVDALRDFRFDRALDWAFGIVEGINKYLEQTKPWELAKDETNKEHIREILLTCVSDIREAGRLLEPFMPHTSEAIERVFGGQVLQPLASPLFPRVELPSELTAAGAV